MAIYTMEGVYSMHGLGALPTQEMLSAYHPSAAVAVPGVTPVYATTLDTPSFLDQWGIPIAAGLGTFVLGLAIAKFATGRKKKR